MIPQELALLCALIVVDTMREGTSSGTLLRLGKVEEVEGRARRCEEVIVSLNVMQKACSRASLTNSANEC